MSSRGVISRACFWKGLLIDRHQCRISGVFDRDERAARLAQLKYRDIADDRARRPVASERMRTIAEMDPALLELFRTAAQGSILSDSYFPAQN